MKPNEKKINQSKIQLKQERESRQTREANSASNQITFSDFFKNE